MLSKLLKHEFRATGRVMLPVYALMVISTILMNLFMFLTERFDSSILRIFHGIFIFTFVVSLIGAVVVTVVLMVSRFYKNYMTDEGYLMFTLPVTTPQLIWSKLIAALVWTLSTGLVIFLVIAATSVMGARDWSFVGLREILNLFYPFLPEVNWVPNLILTVVLALVALLSSYLMFYAAIAIGHSFSNHKGVLSVVFYILFTVAMQILTVFTSIFTVEHSTPLAPAPNSMEPALAFLRAFLTGNILLYLLVGAAFYLLTRYFLKRRLNLQ